MSTRLCEHCGKEITDISQHPYAHRCAICRYTEKKVHVKSIHCRRCGKLISDLETHPSAHLCPTCREHARRLGFCIVDKYRPMIEAHLNEHGWPHYGSALKIVREYPDILSGCPEIHTQKRKQQIIAACIKNLRDPDGRHYTVYNTQQYQLTEATV